LRRRRRITQLTSRNSVNEEEEGEGWVQLDHGKLQGKREREREEQLHMREVLWPTPLLPLFE